MANRSIQQKILKMKRRNRYSRFSGATTKVVERIEERLEHVGEDKHRVKQVRVFVGLQSLSKQVINTGRGPNAERMQEYYGRAYASDGSPDKKSDEVIKELLIAYARSERVSVHKITVFKDSIGSIELLCKGEECFFVELENGELTRQSRVYNSRRTAFDRYNNNRIAWTE